MLYNPSQHGTSLLTSGDPLHAEDKNILPPLHSLQQTMLSKHLPVVYLNHFPSQLSELSLTHRHCTLRHRLSIRSAPYCHEHKRGSSPFRSYRAQDSTEVSHVTWKLNLTRNYIPFLIQSLFIFKVQELRVVINLR